MSNQANKPATLLRSGTPINKLTYILNSNNNTIMSQLNPVCRVPTGASTPIIQIKSRGNTNTYSNPQIEISSLVQNSNLYEQLKQRQIDYINLIKDLHQENHRLRYLLNCQASIPNKPHTQTGLHLISNNVDQAGLLGESSNVNLKGHTRTPSFNSPQKYVGNTISTIHSNINNNSNGNNNQNYGYHMVPNKQKSIYNELNKRPLFRSENNSTYNSSSNNLMNTNNQNQNKNSKKQQNGVINKINRNLQVVDDHAYANMHIHSASTSGQLVNKDIRMDNDRFSFADDKNNHQPQQQHLHRTSQEHSQYHDNIRQMSVLQIQVLTPIQKFHTHSPHQQYLHNPAHLQRMGTNNMGSVNYGKQRKRKESRAMNIRAVAHGRNCGQNQEQYDEYTSEQQCSIIESKQQLKNNISRSNLWQITTNKSILRQQSRIIDNKYHNSLSSNNINYAIVQHGSRADSDINVNFDMSPLAEQQLEYLAVNHPHIHAHFANKPKGTKNIGLQLYMDQEPDISHSMGANAYAFTYDNSKQTKRNPNNNHNPYDNSTQNRFSNNNINTHKNNNNLEARTKILSPSYAMIQNNQCFPKTNRISLESYADKTLEYSPSLQSYQPQSYSSIPSQLSSNSISISPNLAKLKGILDTIKSNENDEQYHSQNLETRLNSRGARESLKPRQRKDEYAINKKTVNRSIRRPSADSNDMEQRSANVEQSNNKTLKSGRLHISNQVYL